MNMRIKTAQLFIGLGSFNAFLAVMMGAFGAHALKTSLAAYLPVYETAVEYHMAHALGLLMIGGIAYWQTNSVWLKAAGWLLLIGIILFSGSLYALSISGIRELGMITPVGGLCLLLGWLSLLRTAWQTGDTG